MSNEEQTPHGSADSTVRGAIARRGRTILLALALLLPSLVVVLGIAAAISSRVPTGDKTSSTPIPTRQATATESAVTPTASRVPDRFATVTEAPAPINDLDTLVSSAPGIVEAEIWHRQESWNWSVTHFRTERWLKSLPNTPSGRSDFWLFSDLANEASEARFPHLCTECEGTRYLIFLDGGMRDNEPKYFPVDGMEALFIIDNGKVVPLGFAARSTNYAGWSLSAFEAAISAALGKP